MAGSATHTRPRPVALCGVALGDQTQFSSPAPPIPQAGLGRDRESSALTPGVRAGLSILASVERDSDAPVTRSAGSFLLESRDYLARKFPDRGPSVSHD